MELSLTGLYSSLMSDIPISEYDRRLVLRRLAAEGVTFLAKELPKVSRAVITGLEIGKFDRTDLTSFKFKDATLHFCEELINRVFHRRTGVLLSNPDGLAIKVIRQLCEYSYKLALPFTQDQEYEAKTNFVSNEVEIGHLGTDPEVIAFANDLRKDFETYWGEISSVHVHEILGSYPPRSTSGTYVGSDELFFIEKHATNSRTVPSDCRGHLGLYKPYARSERAGFRFKNVTEVTHSELLLVPKDSRGPRTICRETLKRVETQMSFFDFMVKKLTKVSGGAINFLDQQVNRLIAEESSVTKSYATLDLKDASDRVSYKVVKTIFSNSPGMRWFISGSRRATHVDINGIICPLKKLAGMGSGLTFPTMSLLISLAICNRVAKKDKSLTYEEIRKKIFVYGDDICLPSEWVETAKHSLSLIGLKVNQSKSFVRGNFRESCGGDYFAGIDVTPCRIKLTNSRASICARGKLKLAENANAFTELYDHSKVMFSHGYKNVAKYLLSVLQKFYKGLFSVPMMPGVFDVQCNLPLDYTKGTGHLDALGTSVVYAVRPERIGGLDDRKVIKNNGTVLEFDKIKKLGGFLKAGLDSTRGSNERRAHEIQVSRISPGPVSPFGDLTRPRKLAFFKTSVRNEFYIEQASRSREYWIEYLAQDRFVIEMSALLTAFVFHSAIL